MKGFGRRAFDGAFRAGRGEEGVRACRPRRRASFLLLAVSLCGASAASGHWDPVRIPPAGDYMLRLYQPPGVVAAQDWQIEVVPQQRPWNKFTAYARAQPDYASCWSLEVPVAEPSNVRVRVRANGQVSEWSRFTVVPEPETALGLPFAAGLLAWRGGRRARPARRRDARS